MFLLLQPRQEVHSEDHERFREEFLQKQDFAQLFLVSQRESSITPRPHLRNLHGAHGRLRPRRLDYDGAHPTNQWQTRTGLRPERQLGWPTCECRSTGKDRRSHFEGQQLLRVGKAEPVPIGFQYIRIKVADRLA